MGSGSWRWSCESGGTKPPVLSLSCRCGWARRSRRRRRGRRRGESIGEVEAQSSRVTTLLAAVERVVAVVTGRLGRCGGEGLARARVLWSGKIAGLVTLRARDNASVSRSSSRA